MRKALLLFILIITLSTFYGCSKDNNESPVALSRVDIDSLNNINIVNVINDNNLKKGVYKIETTNNNYIYFNGIKIEYTDILCRLEDKNLVISCNTSTSSVDNKKLYVIKEKSNTSYNNQSSFYEILTLEINNKESHFTNIYSFT